MSHPRGLTAEESAAWEKLAQSVTPIAGRVRKAMPVAKVTAAPAAAKPAPANQAKPKRKVAPKAPVASRTTPLVMAPPATARRAFHSELDSRWNRKLKNGQIAPDYTLDLHGHTLDSAYSRIMSGLDQANAMNARLVLVVAGRERPVDPADRASKRGAIRAKLLDWLAVSHHADNIAAVRRAHIRHGGDGALYLVLKRR